MKFSRSTIFLAVSFFLVSSLAAAAPWRPLNSPEGNFSVLMPGTPVFRIDSQKSFVGNIVTHVWDLKTKTGQYSASYSDLPSIAVDFGGEATILDKAKKGFLKDNGGIERSFVATQVAGFPAKSLSYSISVQGMNGKAHFILVQKRLYLLTAAQGSDGDPSNVERFLSSFKLLNIPIKK